MDRYNSSGSVLLWIITIALLIFTAARSVDLIQSTLPDQSKVLAYAALAGLDGGVLAWLFWTTRNARGGIQRTIGSLMIVVDLAGISAAVIGDTIRIADPGDKTLVATVAIYVVPVIIVANIIATVTAHLFDPDQALRDAQRAIHDELEWQKARHLRDNAATIAQEVAQRAAIHEAEQMVARFEGAQAFSHNGDRAKEMSGAGPGTPTAKAVRRPSKPANQSQE